MTNLDVALFLFFSVCVWLSIEALKSEPQRLALRPVPIKKRRLR
jgi:hypothetical protein